jgi:hypothetical protein
MRPYFKEGVYSQIMCPWKYNNIRQCSQKDGTANYFAKIFRCHPEIVMQKLHKYCKANPVCTPHYCANFIVTKLLSNKSKQKTLVAALLKMFSG